jgi:hypothetical protein
MPESDATTMLKKIKINGAVLSRSMAAVLVEHGIGPRPRIIAEKDTINALRARQLIRFNRVSRPTHTVATSQGRELIAALLAAQADALAATAAE